MTLDRLERIVLRLANQTLVRYWKHWNYPILHPWQMAVMPDPAPQGATGDRIRRDMQDLGFVWHDRFQLWVVERTNEDGSSFRTDGPPEDQ